MKSTTDYSKLVGSIAVGICLSADRLNEAPYLNLTPSESYKLEIENLTNIEKQLNTIIEQLKYDLAERTKLKEMINV